MVPIGDFDEEAEKQNNKGMFYSDKLNIVWSETADTVEYKEAQIINETKLVKKTEVESKTFSLFEEINNRLFDS